MFKCYNKYTVYNNYLTLNDHHKLYIPVRHNVTHCFFLRFHVESSRVEMASTPEFPWGIGYQMLKGFFSNSLPAWRQIFPRLYFMFILSLKSKSWNEKKKFIRYVIIRHTIDFYFCVKNQSITLNDLLISYFNFWML